MVAATPPSLTVFAVPIRAAIPPDNGNEIMDPIAATSSSAPVWPSLSPSVSDADGIRAAQLANTSPLSPKIAKVAHMAGLTLLCTSKPYAHRLSRVYQWRPV
ncbi:hypothetical protein GCM10027404_23330 [Arthrobacter tumbae]